MISYNFFYSAAVALLKLGPDIWKLLLIMPALLTPHYSIEYRSYFTHWHITVVGLFGATECLIIQIICMMMSWASPLSNDFF